MIATICDRCGRAVTYDAARPGGQPKNVKHTDVPGQPADCPE
ncbi:hypothetical protein AB0A91_34270 [Streptomyces sp. NPDC042207]